VKKKNTSGREDVHPQNGLNGLILNWCIGGYWFTPAGGMEEDPEVVDKLVSFAWVSFIGIQ
jgi:hypothetical protein